MKSVLHVALIAPNGYSNAGLMKGFFDAGFSEYHLFDFQRITFEFDRETMRRMLIQEADRLKPDMIFMQIQGSDILDIATFMHLSEISFTVNYTFDKRSKEQSEWLYNLPFYIGLLCLSNQEDVQECKNRGYNNVMVLQSSADPEVYKPAEGMERKGIIFIGNNFMNTNIEFPLSKERVEMVEFLKKEFPDQFKVYGNNWSESKLTTQKEEIEILQSAEIVINQNNFDAELYTSDRMWRTMLCGAFCLTKYSKGVEGWLEYGEDDARLLTWKTLDELKDKISFYLSHPEMAIKQANIIREYAMKNHTWGARIKQILTFIQGNIMDLQAYAIPIPSGTDLCMKFGAHVIDGVIPGSSDERFNDRLCNCGKLRFVWEECGCANKEYQLRAHENI